MRGLLAALGRVCLSLIFLLAGINKLMDWQGSLQVVAGALNQWMQSYQGIGGMQQLIQMALPWTSTMLIIACMLELFGGFLLLFGIKVRWGAFFLILFLIPTTLIMHHFWLLQSPQRELEMGMFLKNLSIFGGLLTVLAFGTGSEKKNKVHGTAAGP